MAARRRSACRKPREPVAQPPEVPGKENLETRGHFPAAVPSPVPEKPPAPEPEARRRPSGQEASLPLPVILEILSREYHDNVQGEALCRAALNLAEECGVLERYRDIWEAEETDLSGRLSVLLFDRRQSLELIRYYEKKGNREALRKEKEKLKQLEGRLLLGGASPAKITEEDLEVLEQYIKECGF